MTHYQPLRLLSTIGARLIDVLFLIGLEKSSQSSCLEVRCITNSGRDAEIKTVREESESLISSEHTPDGKSAALGHGQPSPLAYSRTKHTIYVVRKPRFRDLKETHNPQSCAEANEPAYPRGDEIKLFC